MNRNVLKMLGTGSAALLFLMILLAVWMSLARVQEQSLASGLQIARSAVERSVMHCYALEGAYPPDLDYLEQNYGLIVDRNQYSYLYEVVGENIHPIIDVQRLEDVQ